MEIRKSFEGLGWLRGVNATEAAANRVSQNAPECALGADRETLSSAASERSEAAGQEGVRMEKVIAIQAALAEGSYSVPASEVAAKIVDSMLGKLERREVR